MIEVKYPGKLFLLGEYSIMEPGHSAYIMAVDRYLYATIKQSDSLLIQSDYGTIRNLDKYKPSMNYVAAAYEVAKDYLKMKKVEIKPFELNLTSELNNEDNKKYGFGSSGVVVVSTLDAILKFHEVSVNKLTLFKLAVITQKRMNKLSSGGDIAASIYGGIVYYTRYDTLAVSKDVRCVKNKWPLLEIRHVKETYHVAIGWTKKSHDTNLALEKFKQYKKEHPHLYYSLVKKADNMIIEAEDVWDIVYSVSKYRNWMLELQDVLDYEIETPELTDLIESAKALGYEAKISGSGGGDCGFVISKDPIDHEKLKATWTNLGLEYIEKRA